MNKKELKELYKRIDSFEDKNGRNYYDALTDAKGVIIEYGKEKGIINSYTDLHE